MEESPGTQRPVPYASVAKSWSPRFYLVLEWYLPGTGLNSHADHPAVAMSSSRMCISTVRVDLVAVPSAPVMIDC